MSLTKPIPWLGGAALAAAFAPFLPAQSAPRAIAEPPPFAIGKVANVTSDEHGAPIALGPDWEARFDSTGARFVAVLGSLAPELVDLHLGAIALRQGTVDLPLATETMPHVRGDRVSYRRGPDVVEHFDATLPGLAHSLVVERPLGGSGDLVATIALDGSVAAHGRLHPDGTLLFRNGNGGITIGALTAIDATGARCRGSLRLAPGGLEWVVPAAFAERATYPLLLDPLVGTTFQLSVPLTTSTFPAAVELDGDSDVAFDVSTNTWLVVWQRTLSNLSTVVRGQRFDNAGAPLGGMLSIESNTTSRSPRVANCNVSNRFVVTCLRDFFGSTEVIARAVQAADGAMSSTLVVGSATADSIAGVDIAGESISSPFASSRAWIVWGATGNGVRGATVLAPPGNGAMSVYGTFVVAGAPGGSQRLLDPTIVRTPSGDGRLAVAWVQDFAPSTRILATVLDTSGAVLFPPVQVSGTDLFASRPSIDGGGVGTLDCVVAWQSQDPVQNSSFARAAGVRATSALTTTGPVWNLTPAYQPSVAWRAGKAYIAVTIAESLYLIGVDPGTCTACENAMLVAQAVPYASSSQTNPARWHGESSLCLRAAGGDPLASRGVVVWAETRYGVFDLGPLGSGAYYRGSPLYGRIVDAFAPSATTTNLGGGCGGGGTLSTVGPPAVGNGTFGLRLQGAGSGSLLAILNWNSPQPLLGCGPCQWLPFGGTITTPVTNGGAEAALPIPCDASLAGAQLDTQWTVWRPGMAPCPIVPDFVLSNAVRLQIQ